MDRVRRGPWMAAFLLIVTAAAGGSASGDDGTSNDWPHFRGPHRDGSSPATGLLASWPEDGPAEVWRTPIGEGYASVSAAGDRIYTFFSDDGQEVAAAFDAATGKEVWRAPLGAKLETQMGNGPRSTPTVAGGVVYAVGSDAVLKALKTEDGSEIWQVDLKERFGSRMPQWGLASSPVVDGDLLLMEVGGEKAAFAAFGAATGELRWTAFEARMGYTTPVILEAGGVRHFATAPSASRQVVGLGRDGEVLWTYEWHGGTIASPVAVGKDKLFVSASNDVGGALLQIRKEGDGLVAEELWKNREMKNHFASSVVHDGYLYGFDNGTLKCISLDGGERQWLRRGLGKGSLILADGHLIVLSDRGELVLVEATPEKYVEKGRKQVLTGKTWTPPALAGSRLYLRDMESMVCLDLAA